MVVEQIRSKVLVVDDDPLGVAVLVRLLEDAGCAVHVASTGEAGIRLALEEPPDVILLDISLPEIDGFQVAEKMRREPATASTPIIFVSSHKDTIDKVHGFEAGGSDYITKPFEIEEVRIRIKNQLRIAALQREIERQNRELREANDQLRAAIEDLIRGHEALSESHRSLDRIFTTLSEVLPGTVLDQRYRLDEIIGSGGFGTVYRGTHLVMDRPIAVKVLQPPRGADADALLERFRLEAMSAYRFNHPNAVSVLDASVSSSGLPYIVMELLNGWSLRREIELGRLALQRCAEIMVPVCDVIVHAHKVGVTHRDIKPDNIFIHNEQGSEVIKVLDFGLARFHEGAKSKIAPAEPVAGFVLGTPAYMAPEVFAQKVDDPEKVDVYAIATVTFEALAGRPPFPPREGGVKKTVSRHLAQSRPRLSEFVKGVPAAVENLVLAGLDRDPQKRPTARAFGEQLVLALFAEGSEQLDPNQERTLRLFSRDEE